MTPATHWILVADSATATLYEADGRLDGLVVVDRLDHAAGRLPARELVTDDRGRTQAFPGGARSATEGRHTPHQNQVHAFAHQIVQRLRKGLAANAFEGLVLVAPPAMLGQIRLELDARTADRVVSSIAHDYTQHPVADLPRLLRKNLLEREPEHWKRDS
jgi:protein required for attachment to host cells